jgi:hypothetical protein
MTDTAKKKRDTAWAYANGDLPGDVPKKKYEAGMDAIQVLLDKAVSIAKDELGIDAVVSIPSKRPEGGTFDVPKFQANIPVALESNGTTVAANLFMWGWRSHMTVLTRLVMELHLRNKDTEGYDNEYLVGVTIKPRTVAKSAISV